MFFLKCLLNFPCGFALLFTSDSNPERVDLSGAEVKRVFFHTVSCKSGSSFYPLSYVYRRRFPRKHTTWILTHLDHNLDSPFFGFHLPFHPQSTKHVILLTNELLFCSFSWILSLSLYGESLHPSLATREAYMQIPKTVLVELRP